MGNCHTGYLEDLDKVEAALDHFSLTNVENVFRNKRDTIDPGILLIQSLRYDAPKLTREQVILLVKAEYERVDKAKKDREDKLERAQLIVLLNKHGLPEGWAAEYGWIKSFLPKKKRPKGGLIMDRELSGR